jgi:hypothetical protein
VSEIMRCSCGANLRVPLESQGRLVRCPKCRVEIRADALAQPTAVAPVETAGAAVEAQPFDAVDAGLTCPICLTAMQAGEMVRRCPGCDQVHHDECWLEVGGCGTFGCQHAPTVDKSEQSPQASLTAWGDTKDCPICGETIKSIALKCRYCGARFETVDPMTAADMRTQARETERLAGVKQSVVALFAVSLLGCAAPIIAIVAACYVIPKRQELAKCGPLYKIMGWTSLVLSCIYSALMLLLVLVDS